MEDVQMQINAMDKRMIRLEDKLNVIDERTKEMDKEQKFHSKEVTDKLEKLVLSVACLDDKFANKKDVKEQLDGKAGKWVASIMKFIGIAVGGAIIAAILDQIIRHH